MLNFMILYSFVVSFWLRFLQHGRVVVPGREEAGLDGFGRFVSRSWILGLAVVLGLVSGVPGRGYAQWWETYSSSQSMIFWAATTVPLTVVLWVLKEVTFQVFAKPGAYAWFGMQPPSLHKISMAIPTVWNLLFWMWLLFSPTLPFYTCFIRIFLGGAYPTQTTLEA